MELEESLDYIIGHPKTREDEKLRARRIKVRWEGGTIPANSELEFIHKVWGQLDTPVVCKHLYKGLCKVESRRTATGLGPCKFMNDQPVCPDYLSLHEGR